MLAKLVKHVLTTTAVIFGLVITVAAGVLIFTAPKAPPLIAAVEVANDPFAKYARELGPYSYFTARDGTKLAYRNYPGKPGSGVAILVHGSSGTALAVHGLAKAYAARGVTVYAVDLRGHGMSPGPNGRLGDVAYRGQYEDDLDDLVQLIKREHPGEKRLLVGHSMGGAIILRTASGRYAGNFDGYLALSPFIAPGTAMDRPSEGGWTIVSVPRIVVLTILDRFGITAFDHLNVLAMAVPVNDNQRPRFYSHALLASANLPRDWKPAVASIHQPARILIGADDELFFANAYPSEIGAVNPAIKVTVVPGLGHMSMMFDDRALTLEADTGVEMLK